MPRKALPIPENPMGANRRRTCEVCGTMLARKANGDHGRFCSDACRMKAYRARVRQAEAE